MMRSLYLSMLLLSLILVGTAPCRADNNDTATNAADHADEPDKEYRDPFWPLGYKPPDPDAVQESVILQEVPEVWPKLEVLGTSRTPTGDYVALLKDLGLVNEGQILRLKSGKRIYTYKITAISKNGISTQKMGSKLVEDKPTGSEPGNTR